MQDSNIETTKTETTKSGSSTSTKWKRWLEIPAFLIVLAGLLVIASYIIDPIRLKKPEKVIERDRPIVSALSAEPDTLDLLFIGDSEAMVMGSTLIMKEEGGISSFNCNEQGQRIYETYFFLKKMLDRQHPKVVILETNVIIHEVSIKIEPQLLMKAASEQVFPILRYHNNWKELAELKEPKPYIDYNGYHDIETLKPYKGGDYMFETDECAYIDPITVYYMTKIKELCDEKNVALVWVSSPSPINMNYPKHNALQKYADTYKVDFIDFNLMTEELGIDWSNDTGDEGDHINKNGAAKVSRYLLKYLKDNYDL